MSDHVIGIVKAISEKATRNGGTVYNVKLDTGQDDEWFGLGFDEPQFGKGDEIEFDVTYNGDYANVDANSVNILQEASGGGRDSGRGSSNRSSSNRSASRSSSSRGNSSSGNRSSSPSRGSRDNKRSSSGNSRASSSKSDTMSKDEWANKDKMIRRQACMNTAINLVKLLIESDAVSIPKKKADAFD